MESVKLTMLALCVWTVILDLQITLLSSPFVLFPAIAGFPLGYLNYLGVSTSVQTALTMFAVNGCSTALSNLSANRYNQITSNHSKYQQLFIYGFNMTIAFILMFYCMSDIPDQIFAIQLVYERLPCIKFSIQSRPIFVLSSNETRIVLSIGFIILLIGLEYMCFLMATMYHLIFQTSNSKISKRTKYLQKLFFFSVALQVIIPTCILVIPWTYVIYSCFFEYYNQALNNLLTLDIGLHGTVSSISMVVLHTPYRQVIFREKNEKVQLPDATSLVGNHNVFQKTNFIHRHSLKINV